MKPHYTCKQCKKAHLEWPYVIPRRAHGCFRSAIVPILQMRAFDFTPKSPRETVTMVLCPALCVLDYHRVRLAVRVHAVSLTDSAQYISFALRGTMPSKEEPQVEFLASGTLMTLDLLYATSAPSLVTGSATDLDAYLNITLSATQGNDPDPMSATLSACLLLSDH